MVFCTDLCVFGNSYSISFLLCPSATHQKLFRSPPRRTSRVWVCPLMGTWPSWWMKVWGEIRLLSDVIRTTSVKQQQPKLCLCCRWCRIVGQSHHASRPSSLPLPQTCQQHLFLTWRPVSNFRPFKLLLEQKWKVKKGLSLTLCFRKFVVAKENVALMYHAPGKHREFNAFVLDKSYYGPYDETTCIDWTDDSKWENCSSSSQQQTSKNTVNLVVTGEGWNFILLTSDHWLWGGLVPYMNYLTENLWLFS